MTKTHKQFKNNYIILPFAALLIVLFFIYPKDIPICYKFVDWSTIAILTGLLIITTAVKESRFLESIIKNIYKNIKTERNLALTLILFSTVLSMFLTNDIALFIVIPLTLDFQSYLENNINKLIIFEALSVNVGSLLTPIGNPQNLFLWHQWGISFFNFIIKMFPLFVVMFAALEIFILIFFSSNVLHIKNIEHKTTPNANLFFLSVMLLVLFVAAAELKLSYFMVFIVFLIYAFFYHNVLKKVDWFLIVLFIIMFIDFHMISRISCIYHFASSFNLKNSHTVFVLSALYSQIISNVPASIFMSKFSQNWMAISYGVNVGGNGLFIGSLANIIAIRLNNSQKIWFEFHKYSVPFFAITAVAAYFISFR